MQIDINSPKSAFLNEKISEESWIFTLLQLSQIVQIKNLMTEGSLWSFYKRIWAFWVHDRKFDYTDLELHTRYQVRCFLFKSVDIYKTWYSFIFLQWAIFSQRKFNQHFEKPGAHSKEVGGCRSTAIPPLPIKSKSEGGGAHLMDMMISNDLYDMTSCNNYPLKSADVLYMGISKNKIKFWGVLSWIKKKKYYTL